MDSGLGLRQPRLPFLFQTVNVTVQVAIESSKPPSTFGRWVGAARDLADVFWRPSRLAGGSIGEATAHGRTWLA